MPIQSNKFDAKMMYIWIIIVKWFMKSLSNVLQCNLILHFYPPFEECDPLFDKNYFNNLPQYTLG